MNASKFSLSLFAGLLAGSIFADDFSNPPSPIITSTVSNAQTRITFPPYPSADQFRILRSSNLSSNSWLEDLTGIFSNYTWTAAQTSSNALFQLQITPLSSNAILTATVLNKLSYGPTPELLDRLLQNIGTNSADAWIAEQLAPETITERAAQAHTNIANIQSRFGTPTNPIVTSAAVTTGAGTAATTDIQAWLVLNAVFADRQLHEVLTQFFETIL